MAPRPTSPCATSSARTSRCRPTAAPRRSRCVFFPYAFSGVCTGEMAGIRDRLDEFLTFDTEVLAISCDPVYSLRAFADADGLNFPLLSDFWPHGEVTRAYDVFDEAKGSPRALVVRRRPGRRRPLGGPQREARGARPGRAPEPAPGAGLDRFRRFLKKFPRSGDKPWAVCLFSTRRAAGDPRRQRLDFSISLPVRRAMRRQPAPGAGSRSRSLWPAFLAEYGGGRIAQR